MPEAAGSKQQSFLTTNIPFLYNNNPDAVIATYKEDYRPFQSKKAEAIREPPPAQMVHMDMSCMKNLKTETMAAYKVHPHQRPVRILRWTGLKTNYKMPTNREQDIYVTTSSIFQAQDSSIPIQQTPKLSRGVSSLQKLGHVEKLPASTHQESYTAPDKSSAVKRPSLGPDLTIPTVKGDGLPRCYDSHYKHTFQKMPLTESQPVIKHSSNVRFGDKERIVDRQTTHSTSFTQPSRVHTSRETKERPKFHLGQTLSNSWSCTSRETFRRHQTDPVVHITKNENFSSVPKGDTDPSRERERISFTTSSSAYTKMKSLKRSEADPALMTRSNVHFGPACFHGSHYSTSHNDDYHRRGPAERASPVQYWPSNILSGPEQGPHLTIAQADFVSLPLSKAAPCTSSQQTTHIKFPVVAQVCSTTHSEVYTPKTTLVPRPAKSQLSCNFVMQ